MPVSKKKIKSSPKKKDTSNKVTKISKKPISGVPAKKVVTRKLFTDRIEDLDETLYETTKELLSNPETRVLAWKELIKYRLAQKKDPNEDPQNKLTVQVIDATK